MPSARIRIVLVLALLVAACAPHPRPARTPLSTPHASAPAVRPVVVQGAMGVEVEALVAALEHATEMDVMGWTFWSGTIGGHPVVVSKTLKGMTNAAAATVLAVERFHPSAILNQGTAGGHEPGLHVSNIVLGTASVNIGSFKTGVRARGAGTDFGEWIPMDLLRSDGSAGQDPNAWVIRRFPADERLLAVARRVGAAYAAARVVDGVIGSSDVWNSELDRIQRMHDEFGTTVEEMETAAAAQVARAAGVPFLGIRVVSNNITNGEPYDRDSATGCQRFVIEVVKALAAGS